MNSRTGYTGLWRHSDFLKLWAGETISLLGSEITLLALPFTAAAVLGATPAQMGFLLAAESAPYLLVGLLAGVWADRGRRRPLMIFANLGRAVLLLSVPLAALFGSLRMEQLYAVAFLVGSLTVLFGAAYQSYLPALVDRERLVEANSKLEASRAAARAAGPGLAGALVAVVTAPLAIALDALSFGVSALMLASIRTGESGRERQGSAPSIRSDIAEGLRVVWSDPLLRTTTGTSAIYNAASGAIGSVYLLFATRELGLGPGLLGLVFACGNVGLLLGALPATRVARRFGVGSTISWTALLGAVGAFLVPLAGGGPVPAFPMLAGARLLDGLSDTIFVINVVSLRQAITPDRLQGRVNATVRSIADGMVPVGAVLGGVLGERLGLRPTLLAGALGIALSVAWLWFSPVRSLRDQPGQLADEPSPTV